MRVFLSGLTVAFHHSSVVATFWGLALSYAFVEAARVYQPFARATNNAIATAVRPCCL